MTLFQNAYNSRHTFSLFATLLVLLSFTTVSQADTVQLAECPKEPNVVGVYINNGKNCVRERNELARETVNATCKTGWELIVKVEERKAFCRTTDSNSNSKFQAKDTFPQCPVDYQRYGKFCQSPCPRGYNSKKGKCIQLKDSMPQHSMTCPEPLHRIGAFCCEHDQCGDLMQERHENRMKKMQQKQSGSMSQVIAPPPPASLDLKECNLPDVPGRFYYNPVTGRCDRSRISEPRVWTKLPRDSKQRFIGNCQDDIETKVLGGCQPKCPPHYKSQKGMCHLPPCSIPFGGGLQDKNENENENKKEEQQKDVRQKQVQNNGIVLCPEGKYYLSSQSI
ncbi:MAG: hypothetical protein SGBAC_012817 [Bacillariaceae sp.]